VLVLMFVNTCEWKLYYKMCGVEGAKMESVCIRSCTCYGGSVGRNDNCDDCPIYQLRLLHLPPITLQVIAYQHTQPTMHTHTHKHTHAHTHIHTCRRGPVQGCGFLLELLVCLLQQPSLACVHRG